MNPDRSFASSTVLGEAVESCDGLLDMAYEEAQRMRESLEIEAGFGPPPSGDCILLVVPRGKGREWAENLRGAFFAAGPDATYEPDKE
jgi:hypothetical protein